MWAHRDVYICSRRECALYYLLVLGYVLSGMCVKHLDEVSTPSIYLWACMQKVEKYFDKMIFFHSMYALHMEGWQSG